MLTQVRAFLAGFLSTMIFHQGLLQIFYLTHRVAKPAWNLQAVPPLGVPSVVSLAFWGSIWGVALWWMLGRSRGAARCPYLVFLEFLAALLCSIVLLVWSLAINAAAAPRSRSRRDGEPCQGTLVLRRVAGAPRLLRPLDRRRHGPDAHHRRPDGDSVPRHQSQRGGALHAARATPGDLQFRNGIRAVVAADRDRRVPARSELAHLLALGVLVDPERSRGRTVELPVVGGAARAARIFRRRSLASESPVAGACGNISGRHATSRRSRCCFCSTAFRSRSCCGCCSG